MKTLTKLMAYRGENKRLDRVFPGGAEHLIDHMVRNVEHGRFERMLSGLTALSAILVSAETVQKSV